MTRTPWGEVPEPNPEAAVHLAFLKAANDLTTAEQQAAKARAAGATYPQVQVAWVRYYSHTAPHKTWVTAL